MSQNPGQPLPWGSQGGAPQGSPQGGYPQPPGQPGYGQGFPQQGGYPQQGAYPQQGGSAPQSGYPQQGGFPPQGPGGFPPQGPGGYGPAGPYGGFGPSGGGPRKSNGRILLIVGAALVLLVGLGGIVMALNHGGSADQPTSSITPGAPVPPSNQPSSDPSGSDSPEPSTDPSQTSKPSSDPSQPPGGSAISLGKGISVTPAQGWTVSKKGDGAAQLSNGSELFAAIVADVDAGSNPVQLCDSYHRGIAEKATNGKFEKAVVVNLHNATVKGASCVAEVTVASGQGSSVIDLYSVVSIRKDGVTVVGTAYFTKSADTDQLGKDFAVMFNSMLKGQIAGG